MKEDLQEDSKDLQLQGMFLDVESRQLFWMQERFHGRGALQAQGKTVFHMNSGELCPHWQCSLCLSNCQVLSFTHHSPIIHVFSVVEQLPASSVLQ